MGILDKREMELLKFIIKSHKQGLVKPMKKTANKYYEQN